MRKTSVKLAAIVPIAIIVLQLMWHQTADSATVLSNLGNPPIVDPDILDVEYVGQGFVVPAGDVLT